MITYNCYFAGNSKPIDGGKMKYGIYVESDGKVFKDSKEFPANTTNNINVAEQRGLTHILKILHKKEGSKINIYGDSLLVINQINGNFMRSDKITNDVKTLLNDISKKNIINIHQITKEENSIANNLAMFEEDKHDIPNNYTVLGGGTLSKQTLNNDKYLNVVINLNIPLTVFRNSYNNFINVLDNEVSKIKYTIEESLQNESKEFGIDLSSNEDRLNFTSGGISENKSNLWVLFMKLAEKTLTNRDEFFEIITKDRFSDNEIENITNLNMFDFYYDEDETMYVFRIK